MNRDLYSHTQDYINRWVISYADFITMLLALFMVLYALSQLDMINVKEFSGSVKRIFVTNVNQNKINYIEKEDINEKNKLLRIFSSTKTSAKILPPVENSRASELESKLTDLKIDIRNDEKDFKNIMGLINTKIKDKSNIEMNIESRGLVIRLKEGILFDPGSDIIKDKSRITLDKLAGILRNIPNSIRIEGHTDSRPIKTSRFPSNWELSTARATNIVKYLVNNYKVSPKRLSAVGYGEYMPLNSNENRELDRRVDIVLLNSVSSLIEPVNINNKR